MACRISGIALSARPHDPMTPLTFRAWDVTPGAGDVSLACVAYPAI